MARIAIFGGLCWLYTCIHLDRQILAVLADSVKSDLAFSDRQLGTLTGSAFSVAYALLGLSFGRMADRVDRRRMVIVGALVLSAATIAAALAHTYFSWVATRAGVALGEAIATPAAVSLMAEVSGERFRARAASVFFACAFAGAGAAALIGGIATGWSHSDGGWRVAMVVAGLPALAGALCLGLMRPPDHPAHSPANTAGSPGALPLWITAAAAVLLQMLCPPDVSVPAGLAIAAVPAVWWMARLRRMDACAWTATLGKPAFRWLLLAFSAALFMDCAAEFWLLPFAQRSYGMTPLRIGTDAGMLLIVAGIAGCLAAGWLADHWRRRHASAVVLTSLIAVLIETLALLSALQQPGYGGFLVSFAVLCVASGAWTGVAAAIGLDILPPRYRGTGTSIYFLVTTVLGAGLGPFVVGLISDRSGSLAAGLVAASLATLLALYALFRLLQCRATTPSN